MKEYKIVNKEVEVLDKIICDICGKDITDYETIPLDDDGNKIEDYYETNDKIECYAGGTFEFHFGYYSKRDGEYYKGEICDDCFDKYFAKLLKKPNILNN